MGTLFNQTGSSLTKDYEDLILSYPVLDQVIEKLGLDMEIGRASCRERV